MTSPLELFINPSEWTCIFSYGDEKQKPPLVTTYSLLETNSNGRVYAPCNGKLSTRLPGSGVDPDLNLTRPANDTPLPSTVNLYLHVTGKLHLPEIGDIIGFAYLNIETATLQGSLSVSETKVLNMVLGELSVNLHSGNLMGIAAQETNGRRRVGFTVLTKDGPVDPAYVYQIMNHKSHPDPTGLVKLLGGNRWPVIETININDAIKLTAKHLYPLPVLKHHFYSAHNRDRWRKVGDHQKMLYRELLLVRTGNEHLSNFFYYRGGRAFAKNGDSIINVPIPPPFDFNILDWRNPFQLEALTEFYVNFYPSDSERAAARARHVRIRDPDFNTPWKAGAEPQDPQRDCNRKICIDFLDLQGNNAQIQPNPPGGFLLELDGEPNLSRVKENYDTIYLKNPTIGNGEEIAYLIEEIIGENRVRLEGNPALPSVPFQWRISGSPNIVIIDPFGPRFHGINAEVTNAARRVVRLRDCPQSELIKVNRFFDTVYFPGDNRRRFPTEQRPPKTYRIMNRDPATGEITLDECPLLGGSGRWFIQAGVSTDMPPLYYRFDYSRGYDHFDGLLFIVKNGAVQGMYRWSSFTARRFLPGGCNKHMLSSVQGNRKYEVYSIISGDDKCHQNYCFSVVERGNQSDQDFERFARYYFQRRVIDDTCERGWPPREGSGKVAIRLHWSRSLAGEPACGKIQRGKNSGGCLVSPLFERFRAKMIDLFQQDYEARTGGRNRDFDNIKNLINHRASEVHFKNNRQRNKWGTRSAPILRATLWLIRPDERPLD